jgi:hypothetical protein
MPSISLPVAIGGAALAGVGGSIASADIGANASEKAAQIQASAADQASQNTLNEFNQTQANLSPFVKGGTNALTTLQGLTGTNPGGNPLTAPLTAQFQPTMAQLAATPGYQFSLQQGELGVQNSMAAQGLGQSGAALKGAANYAEGLAGTTYQNQFQNYLAGNQQTFNMLSSQAGLGENAAAMTGQQGLTATGQAGNFLTSGAAAGAAGIIGGANAITGGINSATGGLNNASLALALNNSGMFGSGGGGLNDVSAGNQLASAVG